MAQNKTLENVVIAFRNFEGKEGPYNNKGARNFCILLEHDMAAQLEREGWNVKYLKEREEGDGPQPYIPVSVSYKTRPPKVALVTSKGITYLGEDEVEMLDWVDIEVADVTLNPYEWSVNNKSGVKAYLQTLFVKIYEDYLQLKWTAYVEDNKRLAIESAPNYIDAEVVEQYELT